MKNWLLGLRGMFRKKRIELELDEELQFHLSMQIEENLRKGMPQEEARRQALLSLGGWEQAKERCRDQRMGAWLDSLLQDLRYAVRSLRRSPALTGVVLITLALGIGANTAIFTVTQAVLIRSLPFPSPERLVMISHREKDGSPSNTNYATYRDWKRNLHSFDGISVMASWEPTLYGYGDPTPLEGFSVSHEYFTVLGMGPYLGRDFLPQEDRPNQNREVILSYAFWQSRLGGDPSIVGKQINLTGIPRTVVGILPPQFESTVRSNGKDPEIYRPLGYDETLPQACRSCNHLAAIARIRAGVPFERAAQEADAFTAALAARYPNDYGIVGATVVRLREQVVSGARSILLLLVAGVGVVLLIACSNIAGLLLVRATGRTQEMAIRAAMGAGRGRILRQLLTESTLLAATGALLGILLSIAATGFLVRHAPATLPRLHDVTMNGPVLLFVLAVTLVAAVVIGLAPAWHGSRPDLHAALKESGKAVAGERTRLRKVLVVGNVALALILLCGASLLYQSIRNLLDQKLGFQEDHVLTMTINLTGERYDNQAVASAYYRQVLERIRAVPGVENAATVSQLPLSSDMDLYGIEVRDKPLAKRGEAPYAERFAVSPEYVQTLRIPLLKGRSLNAQDTTDSLPVVLVNRVLAERIWPGEDPLGKQIHIGEPSYPWRTVVGVVDDVRHGGLQEPFHMQFYMPFEQWHDSGMNVVVRTSVDPASLASAVRAAIRSVDPNQPVYRVATMHDVVEAQVAQKKYGMRLMGFFAATALFLAFLGVYGVSWYAGSQRVRELAVRMALGADRRAILVLLLGNGLTLALGGIVAGVAGALLLLRFLQDLLFGIRAADPGVLALAAAVLLAVVFAGNLLPALRASRLEPARALRSE